MDQEQLSVEWEEKAEQYEGGTGMRKTLAKIFKKNNKNLFIILIILLAVSTTLSVFSLLQPTTITNQTSGNTPQIVTNYDYKATITPNILYPNGGTIDAGETIFKKITTAIPFNLNSTIHSQGEITAEGTYEVQLVIKAGGFWERAFPLEQKQTFHLSGTTLPVIDQAFTIDLEKIYDFIMQVEHETDIRPSEYSIEVVPNIEGTIHSAGKELAIPKQDNLIFQYLYEEMTLASDTTFTSQLTPVVATQIMPNSFNLFGLSVPLASIRISSTILSFFLLLSIIYLRKSTLTQRSTLPCIEKINKKYAKRLIPVTQKINVNENSIFTLDSFKSILKIADEKELPIFFCKNHQVGSAEYFIVDGNYVYSYQTALTGVVQGAADESEKGKAYAIG